MATNVLNSSVPGLKGGWDFGWRDAPQLAPAEGWTQISALRQTRQDREQKEGRFCRNRQAGWLMSVTVKRQREAYMPGGSDAADTVAGTLHPKP